MNVDLGSDLPRGASTLYRMLEHAVQRWPDRPFVVADGHRLGYREVFDRAGEVGRALAACGVGRGDRVAIWMSNLWEWVVVQMAVARVGAVLVPLNTRLRSEDLRHALHDCGACVLFTQGASHGFSYLDVIKDVTARPDAVPALRHVVVARPGKEPAGAALPWTDWDTFVAGARDVQLAPETDPSRCAWTLYTSGTTSLPKGVMLSHRNLNNAFNFVPDLRDGDVMFSTFPLFAITGCQNSVLAMLLVGGCVVVQEHFEPAGALTLIEEQRCTVIGGIVGVLKSLAEAPGFDPARVATLRHGAVFPRRPEHLPLFRRFGLKTVLTGYGMTETCAVVTCVSDLADEELRADGRPVPGVEVRLVAEDGGEAGIDVAGELCVRGPQVMMGYFNRPDETAAAFDAEGWFHTGDIASRDAAGRITWIGRRSDIYKCSGFNVASLEVEAFLAAHPAVAEVAVLGVPDPDRGEVGAAFVVPQPGVPRPTLEALQRHCAGRIASYKIPAYLRVVDMLPKTASGKVRKVELRADFHPDEGA